MLTGLPEKVVCKQCGRVLTVRRNELIKSIETQKVHEEGTIFVRHELFRVYNVCCYHCRKYNPVYKEVMLDEERE